MNARTQPTEADSPLNVTRSARSGNDLPLFARPLNASKFPTQDAGTGLSAAAWSRRAAVGIAVLTCGVLLALARPDSAQNLPVSRNAAPATHPANNSARSTRNTHNTLVAQARPAATANTPSIEPQSDATEESRRSVDFYTQSVRGNMFNAPIPPAPKAAPVVVAPKKPVVKPVPVPVPVLPEINPFADWSYTGTITMGDQTIALLENSKTKEPGQFVKPGDTFLGAQVSSITDQMVTLQSGNKPRMLAKSDNINVTPLDRSAIPTSAGQAPQQPQMAQPAQQAQQFGGNGGRNWQGNMGNATFTLPNGQQMNAQQFQRRTQRMNNNFNAPGG